MASRLSSGGRNRSADAPGVLAAPSNILPEGEQVAGSGRAQSRTKMQEAEHAISQGGDEPPVDSMINSIDVLSRPVDHVDEAASPHVAQRSMDSVAFDMSGGLPDGIGQGLDVAPPIGSPRESG